MKTIFTLATALALAAPGFARALPAGDADTAGPTAASPHENTSPTPTPTDKYDLSDSPSQSEASSVVTPYGSSSSSGGNVNAAAPAQTHVSRAQVKDVQKALSANGFNVKQDGTMGRQTTDAIRHFQRDNDLMVTGQLDSETMKLLSLETQSATPPANKATDAPTSL